MIRTIVTVALAAWPAAALAQNQFEGLDLTALEEKPEEKKETPPAEKAPPLATTEPRKAATKADTGQLRERDLTQEDRVKSVQQKLYFKRRRFEIAPYIGTNVNDPYYGKFGPALRVGYYLADTLALSLRGSYYWVVPTEDVRTAKRNFNSRIFYSVPIWSAMGNVEWSPFYGKVAIFNSILHFDGYLLGGAGAVYAETSSTTNPDGSVRGAMIAGDVGLGMRFVAKDYLAVNVAWINTSYVDQPAGTTKAALQNMQMLYAGVSLFIPFKSTWREAE